MHKDKTNHFEQGNAAFFVRQPNIGENQKPKNNLALKKYSQECFTQRNSKQIFLVAPNPSHNPNTLPTAQARP